MKSSDMRAIAERMKDMMAQYDKRPRFVRPEEILSVLDTASTALIEAATQIEARRNGPVDPKRLSNPRTSTARNEERRRQAERAFEAYNFSGFNVIDSSGWEAVTNGQVIISMSRPVFFKHPGGSDKPSLRVDFVVLFSSSHDSDQILQAVAKSSEGQFFPHMSGRDLNRLEAADRAFSDYDFGPRDIVGNGYWRGLDASSDGTRFQYRKSIRLKSDGKPEGEACDFEVIFDQDDSDSFVPQIVVALDSRGNEIGTPVNLPKERAIRNRDPEPSPAP